MVIALAMRWDFTHQSADPTGLPGQGSGGLVEAVALVTACAKTADQGQTEGLRQWSGALNGEGQEPALSHWS